MSRGVVTQSSRTAVERLLPKKRTRTRVAMKPTGVNGAVATEATGQSWANVPRALRPRIERARLPQAKASKALKAQATGANQPLARSGSGHVALGPWSGPFGTQTSLDDIPVVYMDRAGSGHLSLEDDEGPEGLAGLPGIEEPSAALSPTHRRLAAVMPTTPRSQKAHTMEVVALQGKPHPAWGPKANLRLPKKGQSHVRMGMINQPRRGW